MSVIIELREKHPVASGTFRNRIVQECGYQIWWLMQKHHPGKQDPSHRENNHTVIVQICYNRFTTPQESLYCTSCTIHSAAFFSTSFLLF